MSRPRPSWGGNPIHRPTIETIRAAAERIRATVVRTPSLPYLGEEKDVLLKIETLQPIGSFKLRGVYNWAAALSNHARSRGISTTSAGNTAQALGYVARHFNVPSKAFLPRTVPDAKLNAIMAYGVEPVKVSVEELFGYMLEKRWRDEAYSYLNPWGEPDMIAGSGTLGLEILEDNEVDTVFVPVGGGGLAAGVGSAIKALSPATRVLAVQPEGCPALRASFDAGEGAWVSPSDTICDGTKVPLIVNEMYPVLREVVDDVVVVPEKTVRRAMRELALNNKIVSEGSGALSLAGALHLRRSNRGRSVCVISGGSVDPALFAEILQESD